MFAVILGAFGPKGSRFVGAKVDDFSVGTSHGSATSDRYVVICYSIERQNAEDIVQMLNEEESIWRDAFVNPRRPNFRRGLPPEALDRILVRAKDRFETLKLALGK